MKKRQEDYWHRWFAWHPIKIGGRIIWFNHVLRIAHPASYDGDCGWIWQYLPIETDIIALQVRARLEGKDDYYYGYDGFLFQPLE